MNHPTLVGMLAAGLLSWLSLVPGTKAADTSDFWFARFQSVTTADLTAVAYGNGLFIAMVEDGSALLSTNGANWTAANATGANTYFEAMTFGGGVFVAAGDSGVLATTTNGLSWSTRTPVGTEANFFDVTYGAGHFVAVTFDGQFVTSSDGKEWSVQNSGDLPTLQALQSITYGNGLYVITGRTVAPIRPIIYTSADLTSWTPRDPGTTNSLFDVAAADGLFGAVGENGVIVTSSDGVEWRPRVSTAKDSLYSIVRGNGQFCAVGFGGNAFTSGDGITWKPHNLGIALLLFGVTAGQETFLGVGTNGRIRQSDLIVNETRPGLSIALAGDQAIISWPLAFNGFTLEDNTDLNPGNWTTVLTSVIDTLTEHTVTVPAIGKKSFRLKR
jgi:hypothetical protein